MEKLKYWGADISGGAVSFICWFTPEHCNHVATILAMLIGCITFLFITIPKALPNMRIFWGKIFRNKK